MGIVLQATHIHLDERVAIKTLRSDVPLDQEVVLRFVREAQAAVKLKGEHIARVSDVGTFESGTPYMVMEFLDGVDLGRLLEDQGSLPPALAVEIGLQVCEALAEAHSIGIVHRDIKPANLFVTWRPDGSVLVKVLDFGISKSIHAQDVSLTQTSSTLGTPAYMSPEQMRSARMVDGRTDIWSLGAVLFEAVHGVPPFDAETFSEMCVKVAVDEPVAPVMQTPPGMHDTLLRCLRKDPNARYASVVEFARDLAAFALDPVAAAASVDRTQRLSLRNVPRAVSEFASGPVSRISQAAFEGIGTDPTLVPARPQTAPVGQPSQQSEKALWPWIALAAVGAFALVVTFAIRLRPEPTGPQVSPEATMTRAIQPTGDAVPRRMQPDAAKQDAPLVADSAIGAAASAEPDAAPAPTNTPNKKRPKRVKRDNLLDQRVPTRGR